MRLHSIVCAFALFSNAAALPAQDYGRGGEFFGLFGYGRVLDDEGSLGNGVNFGGGIGYRFVRRLGIEAEVAGFRHSRDFASGLSSGGSGLLALGNGLVYFTGGRVQPYLVGGAGILHYRNKSGSDFPRPADSGTGLALDLGAGLKIFASRRFSIRPDFRIVVGRAGDAIEPPFVGMRASIGVGYHW